MVGFWVLAWLLVLVVLVMMFAVNTLSLGMFTGLFLGSTVLFIFLIIRSAKKGKKAKTAAPQPEPGVHASLLEEVKQAEAELQGGTPSPGAAVPSSMPAPEPLPEPVAPEPTPGFERTV